MASWSEIVRTAPALAGEVQVRFDRDGLGLLATLRRDGSPRISGIEPLFGLGELWLGMMPESRKALDLLRDPRFALHNATIDKQVASGDAKLAGRAIPVDDETTFDAFRNAFAAQAGDPPPTGPFHLFRADVSEVSMLRPAGDHLDIDLWCEGAQVERIERF